jgi:hypothetical protein
MPVAAVGLQVRYEGARVEAEQSERPEVRSIEDVASGQRLILKGFLIGLLAGASRLYL